MKTTALRAWERSIEADPAQDRMNSTTWKLNDLWRAACREAQANDDERQGLSRRDEPPDRSSIRPPIQPVSAPRERPWWED